MTDIEIIKRSEQAEGNFNNGEILEKKPIGFPQDGGKSRPYSNIFYWAHAWTNEKKSTIGLHPHQGFEICSFILNGKINHYDTKQERWITLEKGDVQIIRAGKGISHAEELLENSEIFQIWFDPDLSKSLMNDASYDDYSLEDFKIDNTRKISERASYIATCRNSWNNLRIRPQAQNMTRFSKESKNADFGHAECPCDCFRYQFWLYSGPGA